MKTLITPTILLGAAIGCGNSPGESPDSAAVDSPSSPTMIRCAIGDAPGAYAYQDGNGPWKLAPAPEAGAITVTITEPFYAVAALCDGVPSVAVRYRATSEGDFSFRRCVSFGPPPSGLLRGMLQTAPDSTHEVRHGDAFTRFSTGGEDKTLYELNVNEAAADLTLTRSGPAGPDMLYVERDVRIVGTATRNIVIDAIPRPVLVEQNSSTGLGILYSELITSTTTAADFDSNAPFHFLGLAASSRLPSDRYYISFQEQSTDGLSEIAKGLISKFPHPITLPTVNRLAPLIVTRGATTRVQWQPIPDADWFATGSTDGRGAGSAGLTEAWAAAAGGDWTVPDFSTLSGWPSRGGFIGPAGRISVKALISSGTYPEDGYRDESYGRTDRGPARSAGRYTNLDEVSRIELQRWREELWTSR